MTSEEKIQKLQALFRQKDQIDKAILEIIGGEEQKKVKKERVVKSDRPKKIAYPSRNSEKRYFCTDCKEVFNSTTPRLDVTCPNCNSPHIDYASVHKK